MSQNPQGRRRGVVGAFFTQALGIGGAQALVALAAPFLTRLYSPEDFAAFGLVFSCASLIIIGATLHYDRAIVIAGDEAAARALGALTFALGLGAVVATALIATAIQVGFGLGDVLHWGVGLPTLLLGFVVQRLATQYALRAGLFARLAAARWGQAAAIVAASAGLGFLGHDHGLIFGYAAGSFVLAAMLAPPLWRKMRWSAMRADVATMTAAAKAFWRFPIYSTPAALLGTLKDQAPLLLSGILFGPQVTGFVALSMRLVAAPISVIGASLAEVLTREISARVRGEGGRREEVGRLFWFGTGILALIGFAMIFGFALVGAWTLDLITGEEWRGIAAIMAPIVAFNAAMLVIQPAASLIDVAQRQYLHIVAQAAMLVMLACAFFVGNAFGSAELALWLSAGGAALIYGALWWRCLPLIGHLTDGAVAVRLDDAPIRPNA
jgi:O-antigen/teichoic acid export membrane protein